MLGPFLLYTMAFGGIIVPKINLVNDLICREYYASRSLDQPTFAPDPVDPGKKKDMCAEPGVQSSAALFLLAASVIPGILSAITSPKLGALSDLYGRLPILCISVSGALVGELITIVVAASPDVFSVYWIQVGYALDGLCGSFIAGMALAHSYASDCTPPEKRNAAFGYFHGCLFGGIALGPIISGKIVAATGNTLSIFYVTLACHFIFTLFLAFVVPESLSKKRQLAARERNSALQVATRAPWAWKAIYAPFTTLFAPLKILYPTGPGSSAALRRNLVLLSAIDSIVFGVAMGSVTVVVLYIRAQFGWDVGQQSIFVSIVNSVRVTALIALLPLITWFFRRRRSASENESKSRVGCDSVDLSIIRLAIFLDILGYVGYTLVKDGNLFIACGSVAALGGMASPTLQSSMTKHVPHDRTGQLLGASGLLHALSRVVAPAIFNGIYSGTVATFPQTVFVCLGAAFGVASLLSWGLRTGVFLDELDGNGEISEETQDTQQNEAGM